MHIAAPASEHVATTYPEGADPEYRVYREHLAGALYEYYAEVTLHHSSPSGAYTRSSKGGLASTPSQAV